MDDPSGQLDHASQARTVGAGTTGRSTAKLSLLQGTVLSALRGQYSQTIVNAYVEANREGQAWLLRHLEDNQGAARGRLPDAAMRTKMEEVWDTLPA